jgi:hypothetical protein
MFSIIIPCDKSPDDDRFLLLNKTLEVYHTLHPDLYTQFPKLEFILVTRTGGTVWHRIDKTVHYKFDGDCFNPSLALNLGIAAAVNRNVIITCPEVMPVTPVLYQLAEEIGNTVLASAYQNEDVLVSSSHRNQYAGLYYLAMYDKIDLLLLNGLDEDFMNGYAWEDTDFGERFKRAGFIHKVKDEIKVIHQNHVQLNSLENNEIRLEKWARNEKVFKNNNAKNIIRVKNGIVKD